MTKQSEQAATAATNAANQVATAASVAATAVATAAASANSSMATDINWMKGSLKGIESKIDGLSGVYVTHVEFIDVVRIQEDHEKRTRLLEQNVWKWTGIGSVLSAVGVALISYFIQRL